MQAPVLSMHVCGGKAETAQTNYRTARISLVTCEIIRAFQLRLRPEYYLPAICPSLEWAVPRPDTRYCKGTIEMTAKPIGRPSFLH